MSDPTIRGDRVLAMREKLRWTQKELEEKSGVGQSTISKIEKGDLKEPAEGKREALARALGVSDAWLRGTTDDPGVPDAPTVDRSSADALPIEDDETPLERAIVHAWSEATKIDRASYTKAMREDAVRASARVGRRVREGVDLTSTAKYYLDAARAMHRDGRAPGNRDTIDEIAAEATLRMLPVRREVADEMTRKATAKARAMEEAFERGEHVEDEVEPPTRKGRKR